MSDFEEQAMDEEEERENFQCIYGIYFCGKCSNLMRPFKANGAILEFKCPSCGIRPVNFSKRMNKECMLYSKQLHGGSKKFVPQTAFIFDPTMPRVRVICPECEYEQAVYFLVPDDGERKILVKLICASAIGSFAKCEYSWDLNEEDELFKDIVNIKSNI